MFRLPIRCLRIHYRNQGNQELDWLRRSRCEHILVMTLCPIIYTLRRRYLCTWTRTPIHRVPCTQLVPFEQVPIELLVVLFEVVPFHFVSSLPEETKIEKKQQNDVWYDFWILRIRLHKNQQFYTCSKNALLFREVKQKRHPSQGNASPTNKLPLKAGRIQPVS
jgi:hypothetical protein